MIFKSLNMRILFTLLVCISLFSGRLAGQNIQFQKTYFLRDYTPGIKNIHTNFYDVEPLADGGYVSLGFITDTFNNSEGILTKYDCLGTPLWTKMLGISGSPTNTNFGSVEADSGDIVFSFNLGTGFFRGSILAGRISASGKVIWMKRIGNNTEFGRDIAKTADGGFIIAGSTGQFGTDPQAADVYLVKIDGNGNIQWTKTLGNPGTTYDEAFSVKTDSRDNIIVAGRCIDEGTFKAFILKTDPAGSVLGFKTFGFDNQRTYCYDLLVDKSDRYLITGSTTILEANHQSSEYDVYLIRTDSELKTEFMNIYEVVVGSDAGSIGEGLALLPDGSYAIGVSTFAFTTHAASGPNAPNKNALYVIKEDGTIKKAFIYNMKGSQYTRVRTSPLGGVILSGFSTAYASNVNFQGLLIKTDENFLSGCFDIDVTNELKIQASSWTVRDFQYQTRSGQQISNYTLYRDSALYFNTLCETTVELNPQISGPRQSCPNVPVMFTDRSSGDPSATHMWLVNGKSYDGAGNKTFIFDSPGTYTVIRIMTVGCISRSYEHPIVILPYLSTNISAEICLGQTYNFRGRELSLPGVYADTIKSSGSGCDSLIVLTLTSNPFTDLGTVYDTISCGEFKTFFNLRYDKGGTYFPSLKNERGCDSVIAKLQVFAFSNRTVDTSFCEGTSFKFGDSTYNFPGEYYQTIERESCTEYITLRLSLIRTDKTARFDTLWCGEAKMIDSVNYTAAGVYPIRQADASGCLLKDYSLTIVDIPCEDCVEIPNVFTPLDQDNRNRVFRPVIPAECKARMDKIEFRIYNRWGAKVYESSDVNLPGWNGDYEGQPAPMESYIYQLKYDLYLEESDRTLKNIIRKGVISLIR